MTTNGFWSFRLYSIHSTEQNSHKTLHHNIYIWLILRDHFVRCNALTNKLAHSHTFVGSRHTHTHTHKRTDYYISIYMTNTSDVLCPPPSPSPIRMAVKLIIHPFETKGYKWRKASSAQFINLVWFQFVIVIINC